MPDHLYYNGSMIQVTILTEQKTYHKTYQMPVRLDTAVKECGLHFPMPCGGRGSCGKCRVRAEGDLSDMGPTEAAMLSPAEQKDGIRLACMTWAQGDTTIYFSTNETGIQGTTMGHSSAFTKAPLTGDKVCYGAAVDIGTTTIAGYLYQMPQCKLEKTVCVENRQTAFGADVVTRIGQANEGHLQELTALVREQIANLFQEPVEKWVITGNTTMLHLLAGLDPAGIAVAPFTPASLFGQWMGPAYLPRCISAYVGADITTAILASGMTAQKSAFLVDIGTNGEMALWDKGKLTCCSTAAGPAFEGAGIAQGMPAAAGAICKVYIEKGKLAYETVGHAPAKGLCGSGLLDAVACLLRLGVVDESGYLDQAYEIGDSGVAVTPQDIRQVQLAKAAIRAGIETLMEHCQADAEKLEFFYIAGGFGSAININSAAAIGLIPQWAVPKARAIGNGAGTGAAMLLQSAPLIERSEALATQAHAVELSNSAAFMEKYILQMQFEQFK